MEDLQVAAPGRPGHHPVGPVPHPARGRGRRRRIAQSLRVRPAQLHLAEPVHLMQLQFATVEEGRTQRSGGHRVEPAGAAEVDHGRSAVVPGDPVIPQPVEQVGVVAVAEEGLGIRRHDIGIEERQDGDLVVPADRGQHGLDVRVGERRHQVLRPGLRGGAQLPGGRVLHRLQPDLLPEPGHRQFVYLGEGARRGERGRHHRDLVAGDELARDGQVWAHLTIPPRPRCARRQRAPATGSPGQ